jgi:predicted transcriptional regulator
MGPRQPELTCDDPENPETRLRDGRRASVLARIVRDSDEDRRGEVRKNPIMITATLRLPSNNTAALEQMETINLEAIVVVDENDKYMGVVERDRILSRMMIALAQGSTARG